MILLLQFSNLIVFIKQLLLMQMKFWENFSLGNRKQLQKLRNVSTGKQSKCMILLSFGMSRVNNNNSLRIGWTFDGGKEGNNN